MKRNTIRRRRSQRAFTLIELLVSLVAGLIVAMAVVGISKDATNTFHEEARSAGAEMSLRVALERLRADLQRAGFMATGNIKTDPTMPLDPQLSTAGKRIKVPFSGIYGYANFQGIYLHRNGSRALTPLSDTNKLSPDSIVISGNMTGADQYVVRSVTTGGACQRLHLTLDSAAMYRVLATETPGDTLRNLFQPVAGAQFLVRVADDLGRQELFPTCVNGAAGYDAAGGAWVDIQGNELDLGRYGFVDGRLTVNPVQSVRWDLRPITTAEAPLHPGIASLSQDGGSSAEKYNLFRSWVDLSNNEAAPLPGASELVAEYAVDLKVAFTADIGTYTLTSAPVPNLRVYPFAADDADDAAIGSRAGRPERIRAARIRLSVRAAQPDRTLEVLPPAGETYPIRYCMVASGCSDNATQPQRARLRSITTEVALPNLARSF